MTILLLFWAYCFVFVIDDVCEDIEEADMVVYVPIVFISIVFTFIVAPWLADFKLRTIINAARRT